jgi:uroporphyrinogen-III synthase
MRSVLVTRPQPAADEFAEKLRREGFYVYLAPLMEYVEIMAEMNDLARYQALVFTSAYTVQIFSRRSPERQLPVLAVGDATAATAGKAGFALVYSANGDSDDVAELIRAKASELSLKKILHPCSEDTPGDIEAAAGRFGVKVVRRPVYKANFINRLPDDVLRALHLNAIDAVTLFSARTAANFVNIMKQKDLSGASAGLDVVCISERVAAELKSIPWRTVRIARHPGMESMVEALKHPETDSAPIAPLPVEKVITAFGGLRRLASRLGIAASTVQGWRKNGRIPAAQVEGILRAAKEDGINKRELCGEYNKKASVQNHAPAGRRRPAEKRQQDLIFQDRINILKRSALTFVFISIAIALAGIFMLAPEYSSLKEKMGHPGEQSGWSGGKSYFGGVVGEQLENIKNAAGPLTALVGQISSAASTAFADHNLQEFLQVLGNVAELRNTPEGGAAVAQSLKALRALLASSPGNPEAINAAVGKARKTDPTLNSMLGSVGGKDLAAAAMLLTLNEFRNNIDNHRPYADDLALLGKFSGNDPEINKALQRLSPYAQKGVMSRETLQNEFKALAADIVMAKIEGRDVSIREQALQRLDKLSQAGRIDDVKGQDTEAVVARAQLLLNQGDVKGAMHELQKLDSASAQAAGPWMENASEYVVADQSSDDVMQGILQSMYGGSGLSMESILSSLKDAIKGPSVPYISPALKKGGGSNYSGAISPAAP